jgi:hypothetical protein
MFKVITRLLITYSVVFYNIFRKMSPSLHKNSHLPRNIFLVRVKVIFRAKKKNCTNQILLPISYGKKKIAAFDLTA